MKGIPELLLDANRELTQALGKKLDKEIKGQIPVAKFVPYGAYGEYRGVKCPHCSIRIYPKHKAGELETCITCAQDFIVPEGVTSPRNKKGEIRWNKQKH